jgi:hypothetical protein
LRHDDAPSWWWWRSLSGHWFHNGSWRIGGRGCHFRRAGCWRRRHSRPRLRRSRRRNHWRADLYARYCRSCGTDARCNATCRRTHLYPWRWRLGNYGACGWFGGNGWCRRWRGYHDPRFLAGLGHNTTRSRRRGRRGALTLPTQIGTAHAEGTKIRSCLPWCALHRRTLSGLLVSGGRTRSSGNWCCRVGHCRRLRRRCTLHGAGRSVARRRIRSGTGNYGTRWNARLGCLRLGDLRSGWTLGLSRSFVLTLLNGLEHVAGLRNPRPVNLLFWLVVNSL